MSMESLFLPSNAYVATLLISTIPNFLLFAIPSSILSNDQKSRYYQKLSLCFASGGLLGDVFIHIIPELLIPHHHQHQHDHSHNDHDHEHHHDKHTCHSHDIHCHNESSSFSLEMIWKENKGLLIGLLTLIGFILFVAVDRIVSYHSNLTESTDKFKQVHEVIPKVVIEKSTNEKDKKDTTTTSNKKKDKKSKKSTVSANTSIVEKSTYIKPSTTHTHNGHIHHICPSSSSSSSSSTLSLSTAGAFLNLLADSMHNFTDGLALGASFASGNKLALATMLSVLFHEIPHEIGDMIILIQNGYSKWQAIRTQFITAIAAFVGTYIGLSFQHNDLVEASLLCLTAGGFLYIATINMLPSVFQDTNVSISQIICELLAFSLGVVMMVAVVFLEVHDD